MKSMNSKYEIDVINTFVSAKFTHAHFKKILETFKKPQRRRQWEHSEPKDLMGKRIAQHVRFKTLYFS